MRPLEAPVRLREQQVRFAAHLRDPERAAAPAGIEDRRLAVYRELFYNNVEGLLASGFPVLRGLRGDAAWHTLVRDFYREHRCHTPLFPELGREFLRYLEDRQGQLRGDPPFLLELAHYEWVELALSIDDAELDWTGIDPTADLLTGVPVLSPLAWPLAYRFPVQQIRPDFQPTEPAEAPTLLLVMRDSNDEVRFKALDLASYLLLQRLGDNPDRRRGGELLQAMAAEAGTEATAFVASGARLLNQLRACGAVLGCQRH